MTSDRLLFRQPLGLPTTAEPPPADPRPVAKPNSNGTAEGDTEKDGKQKKPALIYPALMYVRRFRENVLKVGGRQARYARQLTFYLGESARAL